MRNRIAAAAALAVLACSTGCVSLSIGGGKAPPTMAKEISGLRRLKWWGAISEEEFQMGKLTVLEGRGQRYLIEPANETLVAEYSERVEASEEPIQLVGESLEQPPTARAAADPGPPGNPSPR